ncbi:hypothetical protein MVI01_58660 [Myxococcus virescens]|uniref:Uncharacterized protein n=1 Tax=Myxococcus virescens TaxID=83456 RepID=A0A511HKI4_9BACT|nr:hypothetical protein MVI01_58660 [Myxococcus virescens]
MTASTDAERRALIEAANRAQVPIRFEQIVTAMSDNVAAVARLPSDIEPTSLRVRRLPGPLFQLSHDAWLATSSACVARGRKREVQHSHRVTTRVGTEVGIPLRHVDGGAPHQLFDGLQGTPFIARWLP